MSLNPRIADWNGRTVWLVGASSGIGEATAALLHRLGARVIVSARDRARLDAFVAARPGAMAVALDVTEPQAMHAALQRILTVHGRLDASVYCAGHYKPLRATAFDLGEMLLHERVNYGGALHWLDAVLPQMLCQAQAGQEAHLGLVASVAGYRGLPHGLAYGPTKAALINLAETLYLDLAPKGIGVSLINPGFVQTPLTAQNDFGMPGLMSPAQAARAIVDGWAAGRFEIHFPRRFTLWMKTLRHLSDGLYFAAVRRTTGL